MTRPEVLNTVFRERPKYIALGMSLLGDGHAAERVFRELLVALDERPERFGSEDELGSWCWKALRNRLLNLVQRGDGRRVLLPSELLEQVDGELERRDGTEFVDQAEALEICVSDLSHLARWISHLYYNQGKGGLETARLLNLKPASLYRDLQRIYVGGTNCLLKRIAMGRTPLGRVRARNAEFERLVFRYLDDELAEEGVMQLAEALVSDPDRVRQFNDIRLYTVLMRDSAVLGSIKADSFSMPSGPLDVRLTGSMMVSVVAASVILGVLVGALALVKLNSETDATFGRQAGAKFATRPVPKTGDALDSDPYVLTAGTIQLRFGEGAEVNIESPALFRVDAKNRLMLDRGKLLALVPEPARGFEVATKLGTVRDLGTEFGMHVKDEQNEAQVLVFQGLVEVEGHGAAVRPIKAGEGILIRPGEIKTQEAADFAHLYPRTLPSSEVMSTSESLALNFSFEGGVLSRKAVASHNRYRDIPSHWSDGWFVNGKWREQESVAGVVNAGTVTSPHQGSEDLRPSDGERCLFLNGAAVRQRIQNVVPGSEYVLKIKVASPAIPENPYTAELQVGFMADDSWLTSEKGMVEPGSEFTELDFPLSVPDDADLATKAVYLTLSSTTGLVFLDEIRLKTLFGGED